jgi:hypothetical protein
MGNPGTSQYWGNQKDNFLRQITRHYYKSVNYTVIDLNGFTQDQIADINQYIDNLPEAQQARIIKIGF